MTQTPGNRPKKLELSTGGQDVGRPFFGAKCRFTVFRLLIPQQQSNHFFTENQSTGTWVVISWKLLGTLPADQCVERGRSGYSLGGPGHGQSSSEYRRHRVWKANSKRSRRHWMLPARAGQRHLIDTTPAPPVSAPALCKVRARRALPQFGRPPPRELACDAHATLSPPRRSTTEETQQRPDSTDSPRESSDCTMGCGWHGRSKIGLAGAATCPPHTANSSSSVR